MKLGIEIECDEFLADVTAPARVVNQITRSVLSELLVEHHEKRIPQHFEKSAHARYHYENRGRGYAIRKARFYGSTTDLIKTGQTREMVERVRKITMRGQIEAKGGAGGIEADLIMRFPFPSASEDSRVKVTQDEMRREISAITDDERQEIVSDFGRRFDDKLTQYYASGRRQRFYRYFGG